MKLTSAKLKQMIRELLLEAYKMTPEDEAGLKPFQIEKGGMMAQAASKNPEHERVMVTNMRRALGRQYPEEQEKDRQELQDLHKTESYQEVIRAFQKGKVTALHDIGYGGTHTKKRTGGYDLGNLGQWYRKYGHKSKDSISTKAWIGDMQSGVPMRLADLFSHGFIVEGFPVLVTKMDAYTQTASAVPPGLIQHQTASGLTKRGDMTTAIRSMSDWDPSEVAQEAVLDNWKITGVVIREDILDQVTGYEDLGLPVYIINRTGQVVEVL